MSKPRITSYSNNQLRAVVSHQNDQILAAYQRIRDLEIAIAWLRSKYEPADPKGPEVSDGAPESEVPILTLVKEANDAPTPTNT